LFTGIEKYRETNRLLALRRLPGYAKATHFLFSIRSLLYGTVSLNTKWCSSDVEIVAMSRYRRRQELLLLLTAESALHTSLGTWKLVQGAENLPRLALAESTDYYAGENN
jgi:hypothetical protein